MPWMEAGVVEGRRGRQGEGWEEGREGAGRGRQGSGREQAGVRQGSRVEGGQEGSSRLSCGSVNLSCPFRRRAQAVSGQYRPIFYRNDHESERVMSSDLSGELLCIYITELLFFGTREGESEREGEGAGP